MCLGKREERKHHQTPLFAKTLLSRLQSAAEDHLQNKAAQQTIFTEISWTGFSSATVNPNHATRPDSCRWSHLLSRKKKKIKHTLTRKKSDQLCVTGTWIWFKSIQTLRKVEQIALVMQTQNSNIRREASFFFFKADNQKLRVAILVKFSKVNLWPFTVQT